MKLRGMNEKYILKQTAAEWLPASIWQRSKQPYRAPIHRGFFNDETPDYVRDLLSPEQIEKNNLFKSGAVAQFVRKIERGMRISETDDMALVGMLSTQLICERFIHNFSMPAPLSDADNVKVCRGSAAPQRSST